MLRYVNVLTQTDKKQTQLNTVYKKHLHRTTVARLRLYNIVQLSSVVICLCFLCYSTALVTDNISKTDHFETFGETTKTTNHIYKIQPTNILYIVVTTYIYSCFFQSIQFLFFVAICVFVKAQRERYLYF